MKRREFFSTASVGPMALALGATTQASAAQHHHTPVTGPLAAATVAFGAWPASSDAPLDRMATPNAPQAANVHLLFPHVAKVKVGGSVNFIIAGFHQIAVYAPGTTPGDINVSTLLPIPGLPPFLGLIDDPVNRVYRGPDPAPLPQDRVEVVQFTRRGRHLVICAFSPHFIQDQMWGWVDVVP